MDDDGLEDMLEEMYLVGVCQGARTMCKTVLDFLEQVNESSPDPENVIDKIKKEVEEAAHYYKEKRTEAEERFINDD